MPILHAPILEQAGFSIGSATPEPVINYVARLDGLSQYWQLSESIAILTGHTIEFIFGGFTNSGSYKRFVGSRDFSVSVDSGPQGSRFRLEGSAATLDGAFVDPNNLTAIPTEGDSMLVVTPLSGFSLESIGNLPGRSDREVAAYIYSFRVKDAAGNILNEIPLTNKDQGATQIATVGSVNATMPNYSADVWEVNP